MHRHTVSSYIESHVRQHNGLADMNGPALLMQQVPFGYSTLL